MMRKSPPAAISDLFAPPADLPAPAEVDQAEGIARGQAGAAAAAANADGVGTVGTEPWSETAFKFASLWVKRLALDQRFALEEVRVDFEKAGLPLPPSNNAWGSIARRLMRDKLVKRDGFGTASIKSSNGRAVALYRVLLRSEV